MVFPLLTWNDFIVDFKTGICQLKVKSSPLYFGLLYLTLCRHPSVHVFLDVIHKEIRQFDIFSELATNRSSHSQVFYRIYFLENLTKLTGQYLCRCVSNNILGLESETFKDKLRYRFFPSSFLFRLAFLHNNSMQLFLNKGATATSITSF